MEKELIDKYEKLMSQEDYFAITKDDLLNIVDEKNIESKESYRLVKKLGGVGGLLDRLNVRAEIGLCDFDDTSNYPLRKELFGENSPLLPYVPTFLQSFKNVLRDKIIIFLLFAATVRLLIDILEQKGKWFDYCSIYILVFIISFMAPLNDELGGAIASCAALKGGTFMPRRSVCSVDVFPHVAYGLLP